MIRLRTQQKDPNQSSPVFPRRQSSMSDTEDRLFASVSGCRVGMYPGTRRRRSSDESQMYISQALRMLETLNRVLSGWAAQFDRGFGGATIARPGIKLPPQISEWLLKTASAPASSKLQERCWHQIF